MEQLSRMGKYPDSKDKTAWMVVIIAWVIILAFVAFYP